MGRKKFNRKNATTFQLAHRSHDDPLYYTENGDNRILIGSDGRQVYDFNRSIVGTRANPNADAIATAESSTRASVEANIDINGQSDQSGRIGRSDQRGQRIELARLGIKVNENDNYDYLQHLRPLSHANDAFWIGNDGVIPSARGGNDQTKAIELSDQNTLKPIHDAIPRELGSNHLDPDLREVLDALEYNDNDQTPVNKDKIDDTNNKDTMSGKPENEGDEDLFSELIASGIDETLSNNRYIADIASSYAIDEINSSPGEKNGSKIGNDGTIENNSRIEKSKSASASTDSTSRKSNRTTDKCSTIAKSNAAAGKGTAHSSSVKSGSGMRRNEQLSLLDARFDEIEKLYRPDAAANESENDDSNSEQDTDHNDQKSDLKQGKAPDASSSKRQILNTRPDFNNVLNDFLDNFQLRGRRAYKYANGKTGKHADGLKQLEEIRSMLKDTNI